MNIFYLDKQSEISAKSHCDKHVVKMVLETAQILCTVLRENGIVATYKSTHKNHPCVLWAGKSFENYVWLLDFASNLCREYTFRYKKTHKSQKVIYECLGLFILNSHKFKHNGFTEPPCCMPKEYINPKSTIQSYRNYYLHEKVSFAKWEKGRNAPDWWVPAKKILTNL